MAKKSRVIKVFIASPGDVAEERRAFKDTIDELNNGFGRGADVTFEPLGWEDALSQVGRRSQSVINADVDACDVFVLVMWRRWGQEAPDAVERGFTSYTEEEFYRALARFEKTGKPEIFVLFKHIDAGQMGDPGEQLKKVLAFRKRLEATRKVMHRPFNEVTKFKEEVDLHLVAFAKGEIEPTTGDRSVPIMPDSVQRELEKHKAEAQRAVDELEKMKAEAQRALEEAEKARAEAKTEKARADAAEAAAEAKAARKTLTLAESAARAALDGKIEEARQGFAKALDGTTNLRVLYLGFDFFERIGELDEAERLVRRWLAISGPEAENTETAAALGNLGNVMFTRGDLAEAEAGYRRSLAIHEKLNHLKGMAISFGNLGNIMEVRGDLAGAEEMHRKALAIDERLGELEGVAIGYSNLGIVMASRDDLAGAEAMHRKSLAIHEQLGRLEGMASNYGNLGNIMRTNGDLAGAEAMYRKSLAIDEKLGRFEGMANNYNNIGNILHDRDDSAGAETMYRKALAIDEKLGRLEGMASNYGNLGNIMKDRGEQEAARELWIKSRDFYSRLGAKPMADQVQGWLDALPGK